MENSSKFRRPSSTSTELRDILEEIKNRKIPVTLWQAITEQNKNIKGAVITHISPFRNKISLSPIENEHFSFSKSDPIFLFAPLKGFLCRPDVLYCGYNHLLIQTPKMTEIRLSEMRDQYRLQATHKDIPVIVKKGEKRFNFKLRDISEQGLGIRVKVGHRWELFANEEIQITQIGEKRMEPPLTGVISHLSSTTDQNSNRTIIILAMGIKLQERIDERLYLDLIEQII